MNRVVQTSRPGSGLWRCTVAQAVSWPARRRDDLIRGDSTQPRPRAGGARGPAGALIALVAAGWLIAAPVSGAVEPAKVSFVASDGQQVSGVLYMPDRKPAPAVILLPMMTRTHLDWGATASRLADAGIAALAIDFRRGGAPRTEPEPAGGGASGDFADLALDVLAADTYLSARADIAAGRIGIAGASIGANVAAIAASDLPAIKSLALLSPSLEYRGLRIEPPMRKFGHRPALIIVSDDDPYALRSGRQMVSYGEGVRDLRVVSGAGHGTVMLTRQPDLVGALVDWFVRTLV